MGWTIWVPPATMSATTGTSIEIPVRAPGLPANLWIHFAVDQTDWGGFPSEGVSQGDWTRSTIIGEVPLESGDIPVASLGCIGLAGIRRETQGIFDSSVWGVALDSFAPTSPGALSFSGDFARAGKSWPGGIWLLADVLVLRPSLIPPVPIPYGTYPPPSHHWNWQVEKYINLVRNIQHLTSDQMMLLRRLNIELQELLVSDDSEKTDVSQRPKIKAAKLSLRMITPGNKVGELTPDNGPELLPKTSKPKAGAKRVGSAKKKRPIRRS